MAVNRGVLRVLDANINRSREGLRVCEDIARFMLNSSSLARDLKAVRHGISEILSSSPEISGRLIRSRDVINDGTRKPDPAIEVSRRDAHDVFEANIERAKESLRVIEEFLKLIDIELSARALELRFNTYDIEKRAAGKLSPLRANR